MKTTGEEISPLKIFKLIAVFKQGKIQNGLDAGLTMQS